MADTATCWRNPRRSEQSSVDGNKRTGFPATYACLSINGLKLEADDEDVVSTIEGVAVGSISETELAEWLTAHVEPL